MESSPDASRAFRSIPLPQEAFEHMHLSFYEKIAEWSRAGKRVAVATVVETVGSTPRKPGTKMLVSSDLELYGTIGGGCVEADVIFAAREVLRTLVPKLVRVDIKAKSAEEIDMLCGGEITLFVEPVMPDHRLLICGGGHISRALAHVSEGLDFQVTVVDDRPQFANNQRFPAVSAAVSAPYEELLERVEVTPETYAVVVTRGHTGDEVCLRQLLESPCAYLAMVGSRSKWANIRKRLIEQGFDEEKVNRVECPAGLDIGSVTPEEIAVSIIARLIQVRSARLFEGVEGAHFGEGKGLVAERLAPASNSRQTRPRSRSKVPKEKKSTKAPKKTRK